MTIGENTNTFVIKAPGPLPPPWDTMPVRIDVEESNTLPAVAQLRFLDDKRKLLADTKIEIGTPLVIRVKPGPGSAELPLFTGEVVSLEIEFDGAGSFTTVRAMDASHRLKRGRKVTGFIGRKASEIASEVARAAGVPLGRIDPTATTYPLRTQANMTDWEFLATLARENDREMGVSDGKFFFRRSQPAASAPAGSGAVEQSPVGIAMGENVLFVRSSITSTNQTARVTVRGWDVKRKKGLRSEQRVKAGDGLRIGVTPPETIKPFERAARPSETLIADFPYQTDAEVKAVSTAFAADLADSVAELEVGVRGNPRLRAGTPVVLDGAGTPFDGKYTVTASRHTDEPGTGYETWVTVSGRQDRTPYGLATGASTPGRTSSVPGVAVGIVTDVKAPRALRGQGWVRLKLPWLSDDTGRERAYVTDWVRTVQLGGVGGGGVFSPEVNDEVLVAFEQGMLDRPYVIGGLYNGVDKPTSDQLALVDGSTGKVNRRSFVSRGGQRIELLDAVPGPSGVRLRTHRDRLMLHLDQQNTVITVHSDGRVDISARQEVTVTGNGIVLDSGSGDLRLTGRSVSVDARRGLDLNGGTRCAVNARIVEIN